MTTRREEPIAMRGPRRGIAQHDFGNHFIGEAAFIPRRDGGEDNGCLAVFSYDPGEETSDFDLLNGAPQTDRLPSMRHKSHAKSPMSGKKKSKIYPINPLKDQQAPRQTSIKIFLEIYRYPSYAIAPCG